MTLMNAIPKYLIAALFCVVAMPTLAQPGGMQDQDQLSAKQQRHDHEMRREEKMQNARRHKMLPPPNRNGNSLESTQSVNGNAQNNGRLSLEERRALRRQINEANQALPNQTHPYRN